MTREIHDNIIGTKVPSPNGTIKPSFSSGLKSIEEKTISVKENTDAIKTQHSLPKTPIGTIRHFHRRFESDFPTIDSPSTKRKRIDPGSSSRMANADNTKSSAIKKRNLATASGNASNIISAAVLNNPDRLSRSKFNKSIYATRFNTTVTVANISDYIKEKIPDVGDDDFATRLLVKKDQQLDKLTFVSFRILCTEDLYNKLNIPDFWPCGIQIGDFLVKPQPQTLETYVQPENLIEMSDPTDSSTAKNTLSNQSPVNTNSTQSQEIMILP